MAKTEGPKTIPAIRVRQWLQEWDAIDFSPRQHRSKPSPHFYVFSLSAQELRSLSGISRRQASKVSSRAADLGIQRQHDPERTDEISRFVEFGFPWSTLSERKRRTTEFQDLRKPGWLPTAIVINILKKEDVRHGVKVAPDQVVNVKDVVGVSEISLPYSTWRKGWEPTAVPPLEVIDGQHRLWAFGQDSDASDFEVPVVAFHGLDISWQAYLFYTINIKPKRINPSLAFDLYPLLRTEDWLDKAEGHAVYRETRSQELTEALWSHEASPWYDRINMLGEKQVGWVTQSAWIKTLMATLVRPWEGRARRIGGLFGSRMSEEGEVLGWSRAQQAAFLIFVWQKLHAAVVACDKPWARQLRAEEIRLPKLPNKKDDAAFYGEYSAISSDQGVRGFLHVVNDLCFWAAPRLKLDDWQLNKRGSASDPSAVDLALTSLAKQPVAEYVAAIAKGLATFDWRTSAAPDLSSSERRAKLVFRGSSGYKEIRAQLLEHLRSSAGEIGKIASRLSELT
ncbi:DGQHR domain-containing protein [Reyranella sp.]|uniref:DGQHR domain-containing protein n=1 Tax=Reyranella sp. TaxID=1929291 RepID=UPI003BAA34C8